VAQNRRPPAYLEYAATILANRQYRSMTLAERGLLFSIRLECWENKQVPASPVELAEYINCNVSEIKSLTDRVKTFLHEENSSFTCPELEDYRQHLADRKALQSKGGKSGAAITNANKKKLNDVSSNLQVPRRGSVESLVKSSSVKSSQVQSLEKDDIDDPFVREINDYEEASNGK
jgi:hypothetical protein